MTYRHATNLRVPFERVDLSFLAALPEYLFGEPVPAKGDTALTLDQLKANGVVGLYVTEKALRDPLVMKLSGWGENFRLGQEWRP